MAIKFFKLNEIPTENLEPSSIYFGLKEVGEGEETEMKCDLYVTSKGGEPILIPLDAVTLSAFTEGLAGKMDSPGGNITQYVRGDGTLGSLSELISLQYFQEEYKNDPIPLPEGASTVPYILIENSAFQQETGAFTIEDGELIITEEYAVPGNKILIFWI